MAIWRGTGGSGESTSDSTINITTTLTNQAAASAAAALVSENNAETAETNAETAATAASSSATNAASSATSAASSASTATTQATNASSSASSAASSATAAAASATTASTQASAASTSATNAASSASSAATSASTATTQASNASTSATNAAASASTASTQATNAAASATTASTQASNASTSATNAASSATAAAASAAAAATFDPALYLAKSGNLSGLASTSTARTTLGVAIGTNVQAYSSELQAIANGGGNAMFKNRIINGAMMIDQRNAGASITGNDGVFPLDRFTILATQTSKLTVQQSTTAPAGFGFSLLATSSSAYSVTSSDQFTIQQRVEGFNSSDLNFGSASASAVTLSFWVRSSLTGTFGGALTNNAYNRSYPFSYTISAANTWEQKTVTITGDTSGTWVGATNGVGLRVSWSLGAGSAQIGTAGAWAASAPLGVTGQTNLVGTSGATFYITGVQLEKGSTATSFDIRPYGTEVALCQRYYWRWTSSNNSYLYITTAGRAYSTTNGTVTINHPVPMRTFPSLNHSNNFAAGNWDYSLSAIAINNGGYAAFPFNITNLNITGTFAGADRSFALGSGSSTSTTIWIEFPAEL